MERHAHRRFFVGVLLCNLFSATVSAAVNNTSTGVSYTTLSAAYAAAQAGETLTLDDGTYDVSSGFELTKNVTIKAANVGAVVFDRGGVSGPVLTLKSNATVEGIRVTGGTKGILLRDSGEVRGTLTDIIFHDLTTGIEHDNGIDGTRGDIVANRITWHQVSTAILVNDGGIIDVDNAIFSNVALVAKASGDNEGANTINITSYLLDTVTTLTDSTSLTTITSEVAGSAEFADVSNKNFARLEDSAGLGTLGANTGSVPRKKIVIQGNGVTIADGDTTPASVDKTDFGATHTTGIVNTYTIKNEGFSDDLILTGGTGSLAQLSGTNADQFSILSEPTSNTIAKQSNNSFQVFYSPNSLGEHTATVSLPNNTTDANPYDFAVKGTNQNNAPVANDDAATTNEDTVSEVAPLTNDTDADNDTLKVSAATLQTGQGTVTHDATKVTYTPATNFNGAATISYTAADSYEQNTANISITVTAVNDAPTTVADTGTTPEETEVTINVLANDSDVEGDGLSLTAASLQAGQGSVSRLNTSVIYTPGTDFNGTATISYTASDGMASANGTLTVTVTAVNDRPSAVDDSVITLEEQSATVNVLSNDSDPDGDALNVTAASVTSGEGAVIISNNQIEYTPAANFQGTATISYTISDNSLSDTATLTVTVRGTSDSPVTENDTASTEEDAAVTVDVLANDSDPDGDVLSVSAASLTSGEGSVAIVSNQVSYTPAANFNGTAVVTYTASDTLLTTNGQLTITVTAVDDPPAAVADSATTNEDTAITVDVVTNDTDIDSSTLTVSAPQITQGNGTVAIVSNQLKYTPADNFNGPVVISYQVSDGTSSATGTLSINVTAVNDPPVAVDDTASTPEDQDITLNVVANDTDQENDTLSVTSVSVSSGQISASIVANQVVLSPAANFNGSATARYVLSDGNLTSEASISLTVTPVNDAPATADDAVTILEDGTATVQVLSNDSDPENDELSIIATQLISGQASVQVVGNQLSVTPAANTFGLVRVSYTAFDGSATTVALLTVTVTPVNDAPVIVDDEIETEENEPVTVDVLENDSDVDSELSILSVSLASGDGTVTTSGGNITFSPTPFTNGTAIIRYTAWDRSIRSDGTFTVTVKPSVPVGTIPIAEINGIDGIPLLKEALNVLPGMKVVEGYSESNELLDGVSRYAMSGDVSLEIPASLNLPAVNIDGASILVYSESGESEVNSFFVKLSLYEFLKRSYGVKELPEILPSLIPDHPIVIGYSDANLDTRFIRDMPPEVEQFFSGILNTKFGIPIYNNNRGVHLFTGGLGFDQLPAALRTPLGSVGIDARFVEDNLGVGGQVLITSSVTNVGQIVDLLAYLIPQAQPEEFALVGLPGFEMSLILPGVSLPAWLNAGVSNIPAVKGLGFEPDAAFQLRHFLTIPAVDFTKGEILGLSFAIGGEGALRIQMPNLINADSLRDAPGREALDTRIFLSQEYSLVAGSDGADIGVAATGTISLKNEWVNPMGIPGVSISNGVLLLGAAASAGVKATNLGAGIDLDVGLGGEMHCLDSEGTKLGSSQLAGFIALKAGASFPFRGFGMAAKTPSIPLLENFKCGLRVNLGTIVGMADTLVALVPDPAAQQTVREIKALATGSMNQLVDDLIEVPLGFAPVAFFTDQLRFSEGELYIVTPGIELPGHISGLDFRLNGKAQIRSSRETEDWESIGEVSFDGAITEGLTGSMSLRDYNIADLIIMENVNAELELQLLPPTANLAMNGRQVFFGLESESSIRMAPETGILMNSQTSIDRLGSMEITAESFGGLTVWPPEEPFDMRGTTRLDLDLNQVTGLLHGIVGDITGAAAENYRTALDQLSRESREEQSLVDAIERDERALQEQVDDINRSLRPTFNKVRKALNDAYSSQSYFLREARYWERSLKNRAWWDLIGAGADVIRIASNWTAYEVASKAIDVARTLVDVAESALNDALYEVARRLEPRLNAYRIALLGVQTARAAVFTTVQGLEAANNAVRAVSDSLRVAGSFRINDASATVDSLSRFQSGTAPLRMNLDFELSSVGLRCQRMTDFSLRDPVGSVLSAIEDMFQGCVSAQAEGVAAKTRVAASSMPASVPTGLYVSGVAPDNDSLSTPTVIAGEIPLVVTGTTLDATLDDTDLKGQGQTGSVWFEWQPANTGFYRVSAVPGDTALQIHDAATVGTGLSQSLLAADTRATKSGELVFEFESSRTYLIAVTVQFTEPGEFELLIEEFADLAPPDNDNLADAQLINSQSGSETRHNFASSTEALEHSADDLPLNRTIWWRFDAPEAAVYNFETLGSATDTILRVFDASIDNPEVKDLRWIKTSDDSRGDPSSAINIRLNQGDTVWISLGSKYLDVGDVQLNWRFLTQVPEELIGDQFTDRAMLSASSGSMTANNIGATSELGEPLHAGVSNAASIWFDFQPAVSGNYSIDTSGSDINTVIAVYSGDSLTDLVPFAANDDADTTTVASRVRVDLDAGTTYSVVVAGVEEAEGHIVLNYAVTEANDAFAGRAEITGSGNLLVTPSDGSLELGEPDYEIILASDQSPENLAAEFGDVLDASGSAAAPGLDLNQLIELAEDLYADTLSRLRAEPIEASLWYEYFAAEDGDLIVSTTSSDRDTALFLFSGDMPDTLINLTYSDDAEGSLGAQIRYPVATGERYVLAVGSRETGAARLSWSLVPLSEQVVANDHPDGALRFSVDTANSTVLSGNNRYAAAGTETAERRFVNPEVLTRGQNDQRLWWLFDAPRSGFVTIDTVGSGTDTVLEIFQQDAADELRLVVLNNDYAADDGASRVRFEVSDGDQYFVSVDSFNGETSELLLNVEFSEVAYLPLNDTFEGAQLLTGQQTIELIDTSFSHYQTGEPPIGSESTPNILWYRWVAPDFGRVLLTTEGSSIDSVLGIFQRDERNLVNLAVNDDASTEVTTSQLEYFVELDREYLIGIAGKNGVQGNVTFELTFSSVSETSVAANVSAETSEVATPVDGTTAIAGELRHSNAENDTGSELVVSAENSAGSRWWQWTAPTSGVYEFTSVGSDIVPTIEVYAGESPEEIVLVAADSGLTGVQFSSATFQADAGQSFFLRMTSSFVDQGAFELQITRIGDLVEDQVSRFFPSAESGVMPARIVESGIYEWQWQAPRAGLVLVALERADLTMHQLNVFRVEGDNREAVVAVPFVVPENLTDQGGLFLQFKATDSGQYIFQVESDVGLLGNSNITYAYQSVAAAALDAEDVSEEIDNLESLLATEAPAILAGGEVSPELESAVFDALGELIAANSTSVANLRLEVSAESGATTTLVTLTIADIVNRRVLLTMNVNTGPAEFLELQHHTQLEIGAGFLSAGGNDDRVAIEVPVAAFEAKLSQVFVSTTRWDLASQNGVTDTLSRFQAEAIYDMQFNAHDSSLQRIDINTIRAINGVNVRLPVDVTALLAWLQGQSTEGSDEEALNRALADGRLAVVTAADLAEMLSGQFEFVTSTTLATIDLNEGYVEFTADHFSTFALVENSEPVPEPLPLASAPDDALVDAPDEVEPANPVVTPTPSPVRQGSGGCSMGPQTGGFDPLLPLLILMSLIYLCRSRRGRSSR